MDSPRPTPSYSLKNKKGLLVEEWLYEAARILIVEQFAYAMASVFGDANPVVRDANLECHSRVIEGEATATGRDVAYTGRG